MTFSPVRDGQRVRDASLEELESWMKRALDLRLANFGSTLYCYSPSSYPYAIQDHRQNNPYEFTSVSVTGTSCALGCEHCRGRYLVGMKATVTPEELVNYAQYVRTRGGTGLLISGGSDISGGVPLARFGAAIKQIKQTGMKVAVHTGVVDRETAEILADAGIDAAMLDVIGDDETAMSVYHLSNGTGRIRRSLHYLDAQAIPLVPHVLVGLDRGLIAGELKALEMISEVNPAAIVIIALSPLRNTPMENVKPPHPTDITRILTAARLTFPRKPLLLGCARPTGHHRRDLDRLALKSGVNGVAYISQEGVEFARSIGLSPVFRDECCSLIHLQLGA
ncbi:MAG: radical SAM protein [Candidatus Thorarchaeota archaeon]